MNCMYIAKTDSKRNKWEELANDFLFAKFTNSSYWKIFPHMVVKMHIASYMCAHTYACMHTHTLTHMHAHTNTHMHTHGRINTQHKHTHM